MGKIVSVVGVREFTSPRERVQSPRVAVFVFRSNIVSVVFYVRTPSTPAKILVLSVRFAVHQRLHAHVI